MRFQNKIAIITASASGIGRASADIMAAEGALVVMVDKDEAKLANAVAAINGSIAAHGGAAEAMPADALDEAQVNGLIADVARRHGRIDILVNAVGGSTIIADPAATTEKLSFQEWQALLHFNLTGTFLFTHAVLPVMQRQKVGKIVNLASIAGRGLSEASSSAYAAAKGGIAAFTKKLAMEQGQHGINVNAIAPATTLTERIGPRWHQKPPEEREADINRTPLRRMGLASDQAKVLCFLASSDADFVTGLTIDVTGGDLIMAGKIGFVGLGAMGEPMARNLLKAGFGLVVHDIDARKVQALSEAGAEVAHAPEAIARQCAHSICMVETTAQAESVIRGFAAGAAPGHIVICMSTVDVTALRALGEELAAKGIMLLDAPVSGGTKGAAAGTLSVICGGPEKAFAVCEGMFRAMGANVFHMGDLGAGLAMKLINNMLLQIQVVAIAEGMVLGAKAGLDPQRVIDVLRVSTGRSEALERAGPRMVARDFSPSGTTDISYKDQELQTALAKALGVPMMLANVSQQFYQMARTAGYGKEDGSSVVKVIEDLAGVRLGAKKA